MPALCISSTQSQDDVEEAVNTVLHNYASTVCKARMLPFLCQYLFGPCDNNGKVYLPSSAECTVLSSEICTEEWSKTSKFLELEGMERLPSCELLPKPAIKCEGILLK